MLVEKNEKGDRLAALLFSAWLSYAAVPTGWPDYPVHGALLERKGKPLFEEGGSTGRRFLGE
jgi:hypothetical protein